MVWCHILFLRWRCLEYYGEVLDANNGLLIIVELDLTDWTKYFRICGKQLQVSILNNNQYQS